MPLPTIPILKLVKNRVPFLVDADDPFIEDFKNEVFAMVQQCLGKTDDQVGDEANYNLLERSFIADVVGYFMILKKVTEKNGSSSSEENSGATGTYLKKAKAGSVEAEFGLIAGDSKSSESTTLGLSTNGLLQALKDSAAQKAGQLGCSLMILGMENITPDLLPFITVGGGCGGCERSNIPPYNRCGC